MSKHEVMAHQCSMSLRCKSDTCTHAKPHTPSDCDCPACCGQWPGNADFKPRVVCIPVDQVRAPEDSGNRVEPEATTQSERLARRIREILGPRNDDAQALVVLIDNLCCEADAKDERIAELLKALRSLNYKASADSHNARVVAAALAQQGKDGET